MLYFHSNIHGLSSVLIMKVRVCTPQRWNLSILLDCVRCNTRSSVCYGTLNGKVSSLQIMKTYSGMKVQTHSFLSLA